MSILKRFSLAAALLTLAGCAMNSNTSTDHYYDDDFSMEAPRSETAAPAETSIESRKAVAEAPKYASNSSVVSEVSKKVAAIDAKLRQVQKNIKKDSQTFRELKAKSAEESGRYYEHIARIRARLQNGTTPGNPELVEMWKQASALLAGSDKNMSETAKLSSETARAKNELDALLETIRETFSVPGAMEIDHENLKLLEDETNQTIVSLNRLSSDLTLQITRQQQYFSSESQNINLLSTEIQNGSVMIRGRTQTQAPLPATTLQTAPAYFSSTDDLPEADLTGRRPLMIIRFDKQKVEFEQPLYKAVKTALDKRPSTHFEVVAVSPFNTKTGEAEAAKNADAVREALLSMGLPASRIYSSRANKDSVKTTEVHLYLK
ncbi:MAG: hypothetical protein J5716_06995 [Alphaproteobacteria bacterium]|nr:hypothetical protein [Alphaproteobacteria bacterium]